MPMPSAVGVAAHEARLIVVMMNASHYRERYRLLSQYGDVSCARLSFKSHFHVGHGNFHESRFC